MKNLISVQHIAIYLMQRIFFFNSYFSTRVLNVDLEKKTAYFIINKEYIYVATKKFVKYLKKYNVWYLSVDTFEPSELHYFNLAKTLNQQWIAQHKKTKQKYLINLKNFNYDKIMEISKYFWSDSNNED